MDLKVFISTKEATCDECGENLGRRAWIILQEDRGALCLSCADMDHLVFLPSGDAALTRRSRKYSGLSAIVLKWSRARKRYERQGILVEEQSLEWAEKECLADADARARRREREEKRRAEMDEQYIAEFAAHVRQMYPNCPQGTEIEIAEHACLKYSGRVGRSAAAKSYDEDAIRLAVTAHIRHRETDYDQLLSSGHERREARRRVSADVERVLTSWKAD